jgi:hypothetical protein
MKKRYLGLFLLGLLLQISAVGQGSWEVTASAGVNYYNAIKNKSLPEWTQFLQTDYSGYGTQWGVGVFWNNSLKGNVNTRLGIGYTSFWHALLGGANGFKADGTSVNTNFERVGNLTSEYISLYGGLTIPTFAKKCRLRTGLNTYVLLSKPYDNARYQRRFFTDFELGAEFQLSKNLSFRIVPSFSLLPMFRGDWGMTFFDFSRPPTDGHAEVIGFGIGMSYKIANTAPRLLLQPTEEESRSIAVNVGQGFMLLDVIKSEDDQEGYFKGATHQSDVSVSFTKQLNPKLNAHFDLGYSLFRFSDYRPFKEYTGNVNLSYLSLRAGVEVPSIWENINWTFAIANYVRMGEDKVYNYRDEYMEPRVYSRFGIDARDKLFGDIRSVQKPVFSNIELGAKWNVNQHTALFINTPLTFAPMFSFNYFEHYKDDVVATDNLIIFKDLFVGLTGLRLGASYRF